MCKWTAEPGLLDIAKRKQYTKLQSRGNYGESWSPKVQSGMAYKRRRIATATRSREIGKKRRISTRLQKTNFVASR